MKISTRLACAADKPAIWQHYQIAMKAHIESIWGWEPLWQAGDFDEAYSRSVTYVVESRNESCGYLQLDINDTEVYLRMIVLAPAFRSRGIGASLLSEILSRSQRAGRKLRLRVFRVNCEAKRFYDREGWLVESEDNAFFMMSHPLNHKVGTAGQSIDLSPEYYECLIEI